MSLSENNARRSRPQSQSAAAESGIEITRHDVSLSHLPESLRGVTIVQLSDFHRGCGGTDDLIHEAISRVNALSPDFIVLTGDFVNDCVEDILPVVRMVSGLRARRGVFAILGNHDHRADPILLTSALEAASIPVLHNRSIQIAEGLHLAGVDDLLEGDPSLSDALSRLPRDEAAIFLCHNPNGLDFVPNDLPLLLLAGHTHGGQIVLPFPSPQAVCRWHLRTRYVAGWYQRGRSRMYVNRGIGVTGSGFLARRINCRPEVSQFRLVPENDGNR